MPDRPIVASPQEYPVFRLSGSTNRFALISDPLETGTAFIALVEIFDEDGGETPPNVHRYASELFFVLQGEGLAWVEGSNDPPMALRPGMSLLMPPQNTHVIRNTGAGRLYTLTTMVPNEGFAELIHTGTPSALDEEDLAVLCRTVPSLGGLR